MHFTYEQPDLTKLRQGDVLRKSPELLALIEQVHPHYAGEGYKYFQVLTQSCDLVQRDGKPSKSRYITLAAVRPLDLVVKRTIDKFADKVSLGKELLCSKRHKRELADVLGKLFNNNDTNHFFLKAAPEFGLIDDCCTYLPLSISIRSYEHYDVCLKAKILELNENFRAKLGWLVGNLYSRVGTEDYVPGALPDDEAYSLFVEDLMSAFVGWIPEGDFAAFKKRASAGQSIDEILAKVKALEARARETKLDQLVSAIARPLQMDDAQRSMVKNVLNMHPLIKRALEK